MGITTAILTIREHRKAEAFRELEFLGDSGAIYSLVPEKILDELGIDPYREIACSPADGTSITRKVSSAYFEYNGEGGPAPVIYGEEGDTPLLGANTLESIGMVLNPFSRTLHPMRMLMANLVELRGDFHCSIYPNAWPKNSSSPKPTSKASANTTYTAARAATPCSRKPLEWPPPTSPKK